VHPIEPGGTCVAQTVERVGLIPSPPRGLWSRLRRVRDPDWALVYIAAILSLHARNYLEIAGIDVSGDAAVLCTLYQGGESDVRARRLVARRDREPGAMPAASDEMGPWVGRYLEFIREALARGDAPSRYAAAPAREPFPSRLP
jgi:hypothetical protein